MNGQEECVQSPSPHLPEHIPGELNKLCDSSVTKLYSENGGLRHIDVFVHIYVARLLPLINDTRKQHNTRGRSRYAGAFSRQ